MNLNLNKKGIVDNFLSLLFVGIGLIVIFGLLFFVMAAKMKNSNSLTSSDINIKEGLYSTRILLNQEISPDYKVYDAVINAANTGDYERFEKEIGEAIQMFYPPNQMNEQWRVVIQDKCYIFGPEGSRETDENIAVNLNPLLGVGALSLPILKIIDTCDQDEIALMPRVTVPNPDGENILVMFKPSRPLDKNKGRLFGYRADQLKGIKEESLDYSTDGQKLERIENIPNVYCSEEGSSVGRICVADARLVQQLRVLSAEILQRDNMKLTITQAYRTYEIQKNLYTLNCAEGSCDPPTCDPDTSYACPHMVAGAIDIELRDASNNKLNGKGGTNPKLVEEIMCSVGFVRFNKEDWHFEYGTAQWSIAEEKRENGESVCIY